LNTALCIRQRRRGAATLWMVLWLPCLLILFGMMIGVANLWLARVELESALEASALAAVQEWQAQANGSGDHSDDISIARQVGAAYAAANRVRGKELALATNQGGGLNNPNQNASCDGDLVFGAIDTSSVGPVTFDAGLGPDCNLSRSFAVRAQKSLNVPPLGRALLSAGLGPFAVRGKATAVYDCASNEVRLVRVEQVECP
jgi:Flp pilus assembly protein TadG